MRETVHDTIILEREINASITAVWNAYVDPIARAQWGVPAGDRHPCSRNHRPSQGQAR